MIKQHFIKASFLALLFSSFGCVHAGNSNKAWQPLEKGNKNYINNDLFAKDRAPAVNGQNPKYVILDCADSRVTPEFIFDKGIGDLFVCRVAGNIADLVVIDSIEYAISHFDKLEAIVVLGHTQCGAVTGALKHLIKNKGVIDRVEQGHLNSVLIPIETAIIEAGIDIHASNALELATLANVTYVANQLMTHSPVITKAVKSGKVVLIGAIYDLKTGKAIEQFFIP